MLLIAKFYFQYSSGSDGSSGKDSADADSEEDEEDEQPEEPHVIHKETITVPNTTTTTISTTAMPTEQLVGDNEATNANPKIKAPGYGGADATTTLTTPVTVWAPAAAAADKISPLKQGVQLDGPQTPQKEPTPTQTPTPESAVASTSGVGVVKKRNVIDPRKPPKRPKVLR